MKNKRIFSVLAKALVCVGALNCLIAAASAQTWSTKTSMPGPRYAFASCVAAGNVYAFGGYDGVAHINTVVAYDPATNSWSAKSPMPIQRTDARAVAVGGKIYILGGQMGGITFVTQVDVYDPATDSWGAPVAPMPSARTAFGVAAIDGIIYVVGGTNGPELNLVEAYDPVSNTWETKASMPTARSHLGVGVINGLLYAVSGGGNTIANEVYDPANDSWTVNAPMPSIRFIPGVGVLDGKLYVMGGAQAETFDTVDVYDPASNSWAPGPSMPTDRYSFGADVINGVFYASGGATFNSTVPFTTIATVEALSFQQQPTPRELTLSLINTVRSFGLQRGISNSFESKLQKALSSLDASAIGDACDRLHAFMNETRAQSGKHLTAAQADQLIVAATQIRTALGCQ